MTTIEVMPPHRVAYFGERVRGMIDDARHYDPEYKSPAGGPVTENGVETRSPELIARNRDSIERISRLLSDAESLYITMAKENDEFFLINGYQDDYFMKDPEYKAKADQQARMNARNMANYDNYDHSEKDNPALKWGYKPRRD